MFKTVLFSGFCIALGVSPAKSASDVDPAKYGLSRVKYATVYCKSRSDGRKPVWMNTDKGTYALNGQAISWVQKTNSIGAPLVGSDGKAWKLARDHFPPDVVHKLIKFGLMQCN